ncbi:hypothetical protein T01_1131 [Trichinella spiralis]|uniref:Uncharacterized protein n=1 Tax=Trichinella spiralis TaxID=6334 RepID=A0A0V1B7S8_TRISP|nr:hypothetical protein T01_1131 [Trichinella spiralis]
MGRRKTCVKENREISSLVNEKKLLKIRYYVTVVFDVIKFLASITMNCIQFLQVKHVLRLVCFYDCLNLHWSKIITYTRQSKYTPNAAICNSPVIQNEPLEIMAKTVCEKTADKYR